MQEVPSLKKSTCRFTALVLAICLAPGLLAGCDSLGKATETDPIDGSSVAKTESVDHPSASQTFTDDLGFEVTVDNPQRVVACMGSFANIWELAGGTLTGATDDSFEEYGLDGKGIEKVGAFTAPNLERIIALEPDFVIMTGVATGKDGAASQVELRGALVASDIEVAYFTVTTFEDYLRMLRICCDITGRDDLYEQNGTVIAKQIEDVKARSASVGKAPTVLLMTTYSGGTRVQNSSTMTGTMLAELGVQNLADEFPSLLKDFSLEAVIEADPDFIFVVPMGNNDAAAMKNLKEATEANPAWAALDAVQNGRYVILEKELFLYKPNADWGKSYQKLYNVLYS